MKKLSIVLSMLAVCVQFTFAQQKSDIKSARAEANEARKAIIDEFKVERAQTKRNTDTTNTSQLAVDDDDVGESDSFNKNAKFFGTATAGFVIVSLSCDPAETGPLGPDDRCLLVTDPTVTTVGTYTDIGRIRLPGKKADNVIYAIANHTVSFFAFNSGLNPTSGSFSYTPGITIESEALLDPAAIDPNTGLPMNGSFTTGGVGSKSNNIFLQPGQFESELVSYSRAGTRGFSRNFFAAVGLPNNIINELYKKPMTIKLNVTVRVRRVESAVIQYSARFLAN